MNTETYRNHFKFITPTNNNLSYFVGFEDTDGFWSTYETNIEQDAREAVCARRKKDSSKKWVVYQSALCYTKLNF